MKSPLRIEANADAGMATLYLYDEIGPACYGLIDAASVIAALAQFNGLPINLRINSPGGDVFEANAMYNALQRHGAPVTVDIDALCASAATIVALAGETVRIGENAFFMVHDPATVAFGGAEDMRKAADVLDQVKGGIAATYVAKTKMPLETIEQLMSDETWMTAAAAVAKGFCDEIGQSLNVQANVGRRKFKNMPRELEMGSQAPQRPPVGSPSGRDRPTSPPPPPPRVTELVALRNRNLRQRAAV